MSGRVEVIGNATLYLGDARQILPTLTGINAVVTSPPYDDLRQYGGHQKVDCNAVISDIAGILPVGGVCVWNVNDQVIDGSESGTSFRQALHAMACGLRLHDTMIVCKEAVTFPAAKRYHPAFEYAFVFSKGAPKIFNGIKDWRNKTAGMHRPGAPNRQWDGSTKRSKGGPDTPEEGLRRNWWVVTNGPIDDTECHPAPMPYSLASDHITTWTAPGDTVCDPFAGSGTAGVAAVKLGRSFVGIEIHEPYFDIACRRLEEAQRQTDMFAIPALDRTDAAPTAPARSQ